MPSSSEIIAGLTSTARQSVSVAIWWHVLLALGLLALAIGWRPSKRLAASLLSLPLASVSLFALHAGNAFNSLTFAFAALALLALGLSLPREPVERSSTTLTVWGLLLVEFAWVYPHFLGPRLSLVYLYGAPLGLVPCPTLSALIGLSLLARGFGSRPWSTLLGLLGLFYGLFGLFRLGVVIDALLALGAGLLLGAAWSRAHARTAGNRAARA